MDLITGDWLHPSNLKRIEDSGFDRASRAGFVSARIYNYQHSERLAGELKKCGMS